MVTNTTSITAHMNERFTVQVQGSQSFTIDQPEKAGGNNAGPNPLEIFLGSLAGCVGAIGRIIAMQENLPVHGMRIDIEADMNKRGLMGRPTEDRMGFQAIRLTVDVDADMPQDEIERFVQRIQERCPIADNIKAPTPIEVKVLEPVMV